MTSLERVMAVITGKPVDRVPVFAVLGIYGAKLLGKDIKNVYTNVDVYVDSQIAMYEKFGFDMVLAPFDFSAIGAAWGGEVEYFIDQAPNLKRPIFTKTSDILSHPLPDPGTSERLEFIRLCAEKLSLRFGAEVPLFAVVPGPCVLPSMAVGLETWLSTLLFDRDLAQEVLEYTSTFFLSWIHMLKEAGVTAVISPEGLAASEVMSRDFFKEYCLHHFRQVIARMNCPLVVHHTGGSINHILDLLQDMPNVIGFAVGSKDSLTEARKMIGDSLLIGNLDVLQFPMVTRDTLFNQSLTMLREAVPQGHFILSTAGADVPMYTHEDNLHAMLEASLAYAAEAGAV